ncbi:hypothetical protein DFH07DRAFT_766688 [Mycena maculata]|uniref:Uncharacterized protein n=1 Tax=Mycena maculata TaxID=230809 RepID=A0AAD7NVB0_9AGAR|nr:hypothetical protein DFH07DRAFT_766688 [Mycena maculata]
MAIPRAASTLPQADWYNSGQTTHARGEFEILGGADHGIKVALPINSRVEREAHYTILMRPNEILKRQILWMEALDLCINFGRSICLVRVVPVCLRQSGGDPTSNLTFKMHATAEPSQLAY